MDETKAGFDCLNNLNTQFKATVEEFFNNYTDTTNCKNAKDKITTYLTNNPLCPNNDCTTKIANTIKVFGDGPESAPTQDDSAADSAIGTTALRRAVVATYSEVVPTSNAGV